MKYILYIIFSIILLNSSIFANMERTPSIDLILKQSSTTMISNDKLRKVQEKQVRKIYITNSKFLNKIFLTKNNLKSSVLMGMTYFVEGDGSCKGVFLLTDSTVVCYKETSENIIETIAIDKKKMTSDQKEIIKSLMEIYIENKSELMKYNGNLSKFTFDGVVSLFNIYDSNNSRIFIVTDYSSKGVKELFDCLRKAYMIFSKESKLTSGA